jgi:hypothetical protein
MAGDGPLDLDEGEPGLSLDLEGEEGWQVVDL